MCVLLFCLGVVLQSPGSNVGLLVLQRGTLLCSIQAALKTCQLCSSLKFMRPQVGTAERRLERLLGRVLWGHLWCGGQGERLGFLGPTGCKVAALTQAFFLLEWKQDELEMSSISWHENGVCLMIIVLRSWSLLLPFFFFLHGYIWSNRGSKNDSIV